MNARKQQFIHDYLFSAPRTEIFDELVDKHYLNTDDKSSQNQNYWRKLQLGNSEKNKNALSKQFLVFIMIYVP